MFKILWLDFESYSEIPIKNSTHTYAENVDIILFSWAIDKDPVQVCERYHERKNSSLTPNRAQKS